MQHSKGNTTGTPRQLLFVTGLSGAGKSLALKVLEDQGFETVDNIPLSLIGSLVNPTQHGMALPAFSRPLAIGVGIRTVDFAPGPFLDALDALRRDPQTHVRLLFITSDDEVLCRRYDETRHRHPLAADRPVVDGIRHERRLLVPLRDQADEVIDTTRLSVTDFSRLMAQRFRADAKGDLSVFVTSFGFRHGLPREADLVFDVRFLRNPHYQPELRPLTGRDASVAAFIEADEGFGTFFTHLEQLLLPLLPRYRAEGKSYLTIAIGCTGGHHRSVFVAESLAQVIENEGQQVVLGHRDIAK